MQLTSLDGEFARLAGGKFSESDVILLHSDVLRYIRKVARDGFQPLVRQECQARELARWRNSNRYEELRERLALARGQA